MPRSYKASPLWLMGPWTISSPAWALGNIWLVAVNGLSPASGSFFSDFCRSRLSQPLERTHLPISGILRVTLSSLVFSSTNSRHFLSQNSDFYLLYSAGSLGSANWKLPLGGTLSRLWSSFYWFDCFFLKYHSPALPLANSWESLFHIFYLIFWVLFCFVFYVEDSIQSLLQHHGWKESMLFVFLSKQDMVFSSSFFPTLLSNWNAHPMSLLHTDVKRITYHFGTSRFAVKSPQKRKLKSESEPGRSDPRNPNLSKHLRLLMTVRGKCNRNLILLSEWFHEPSRWQASSLVNKCKPCDCIFETTLPRHHVGPGKMGSWGDRKHSDDKWKQMSCVVYGVTIRN